MYRLAARGRLSQGNVAFGQSSRDDSSSSVPAGAITDPDTGFYIADPDTGDAIVDPDA